MLTNHLPRVSIAHLPTPIEEMRRLAEALGGPRLLIKRDDQTGLALGGNKARKLEFLVAEALQQGVDTLITTGAIQSNHARQTAAAAAKFGLRAILFLVGERPPTPNGNLLLNELLGAEVRWLAPARKAAVGDEMEQIAREVESTGHRPYVIPMGGSNAVGAAGYVRAMAEAMEQWSAAKPPDRVVVASSSGGTQAGLVVGAKALGFGGQIVGISVSEPKAALQPKLQRLAEETAARVGLDLKFKASDFIVYDDYLGAGYAVLGPAEVEAIRLTAKSEGILLDPVYTGRAMAGLIDLVRRRVFDRDEAVLFWHTGGTPALFAYAEELRRPSS
jgi:D-cysteine desulfhydrase